MMLYLKHIQWLWLSLLGLWTPRAQTEVLPPVFAKELQASVEFTVKGWTAGPLFFACDSAQKPQWVYSPVFSPVCTTGECLPVRLVVMWDMSGNFLGFVISKDDELTKLNHWKFSTQDYYLLFHVLNDNASRLGKLDAHKLAADSRTDATSGATVDVYGEYWVPGAVYTCHTLWHLLRFAELQPELALKREYFMLPTDKVAWREALANLVRLSAAELSVLMAAADKEGLLRKQKMQRLLVNQLANCTSIQALIVHNALRRQVFLFPEIAHDLIHEPIIEKAFDAMLPPNS